MRLALDSSPTPLRTGAFALLLGLLVTGALPALILFASNDMRWILAFGSVALLLAGAWLGGRRQGGPVAFVLLVAPPLLLFGLAVVPELPALWPHLVFWLVSALVGWLGWRPRASVAATGVAVLVVAVSSVWYARDYVPKAISDALTQHRDDPAPSFVLDRLDGSPYPVASLAGKVVVLDFFATWCAPCIAELPELEEVRRHFAGRDDVTLLVVANDSGNDTRDSIRAFVAKRGLELEFAYDPGGKAHKAFGFAGLPGLVVIDRTGRIRLSREGYNSAESGFRKSLEDLVESL